MADLRNMTDWNELERILRNREARRGPQIDQGAMLAHLRSRVKGQDPILEDVTKLLWQQMAKTGRSAPIANLLFLGPTGTGKTELAKAIGEFLFGDEKSIIRFDCSEFAGPESKTRLIGIPTGYVGAERGGQLTRPVIQNPRRLILFDEIEKAYTEVFDLFLQLMGEARLTEQGSGKTVDFSQCIIILTSNAHAEEILKIQRDVGDQHELINALKGHLVDTRVFRAEILGRIDRVYVFNALEGMVIAEIALLKISKLAKEYGLKVKFVAPDLIVQALEANQKVSRFGIRELERILSDMFASDFVRAKQGGASEVTVGVKPDGTPNVKVTP
jgi:ATP-dependent Clp protease ATP-binding subunit ClpA